MREGTPARFGSAIVTTEASPGLFAQERTLYAPRRGDASVFRSACHREGTSARFGSAIVTTEASPGALAISCTCHEQTACDETKMAPVERIAGDICPYRLFFM